MEKFFFSATADWEYPVLVFRGAADGWRSFFFCRHAALNMRRVRRKFNGQLSVRPIVIEKKRQQFHSE